MLDAFGDYVRRYDLPSKRMEALLAALPRLAASSVLHRVRKSLLGWVAGTRSTRWKNHLYLAGVVYGKLLE